MKDAFKLLHFSSVTKDLLPATYVSKERGKIEVKGKGEMTTYWLESKSNRKAPQRSEARSNLL